MDQWNNPYLKKVYIALGISAGLLVLFCGVSALSFSNQNFVPYCFGAFVLVLLALYYPFWYVSKGRMLAKQIKQMSEGKYMAHWVYSEDEWNGALSEEVAIARRRFDEIKRSLTKPANIFLQLVLAIIPLSFWAAAWLIPVTGVKIIMVFCGLIIWIPLALAISLRSSPLPGWREIRRVRRRTHEVYISLFGVYYPPSEFISFFEHLGRIRRKWTLRAESIRTEAGFQKLRILCAFAHYPDGVFQTFPIREILVPHGREEDAARVAMDMNAIYITRMHPKVARPQKPAPYG